MYLSLIGFDYSKVGANKAYNSSILGQKFFLNAQIFNRTSIRASLLCIENVKCVIACRSSDVAASSGIYSSNIFDFDFFVCDETKL